MRFFFFFFNSEVQSKQYVYFKHIGHPKTYPQQERNIFTTIKHHIHNTINTLRDRPFDFRVEGGGFLGPSVLYFSNRKQEYIFSQCKPGYLF